MRWSGTGKIRQKMYVVSKKTKNGIIEIEFESEISKKRPFFPYHPSVTPMTICAHHECIMHSYHIYLLCSQSPYEMGAIPSRHHEVKPGMMKILIQLKDERTISHFDCSSQYSIKTWEYHLIRNNRVINWALAVQKVC
jgi:hypothetical protein